MCPMTREKITIAGWFGSGNFGDELLLHSLLSIVARADPSSAVVVLCPDPDHVRLLHGCEAMSLPALRGSTHKQRVGVRRALSQSRAVLLGPGTIFQERSDVLRWPGTLPMF